YIVDNGKREKYSDEGEPSQSSGPPILNHLKGNNIVNAIIIVTRYFGGIKLGIGGLVRAYGSSAKLVIESAGIIPFVLYANVRIVYNYNHTSYVMHIIDKFDAEIMKNEYSNVGIIIVKIKEDKLSSFVNEMKNPTMPDIEVLILE
ncbi:MAG TPA: YigZ family protein, partial [Firmicutes bacterium]|nr:YigZ family protein [Bacillota bacterium]